MSRHTRRPVARVAQRQRSDDTHRRFVLASLLALILCLTAFYANRADAVQGLPDFTTLVKKNHAAVVNISASRAVSGNITGPDGGGNSPEDLLRRYERERAAPRRPDPSAQGSGFIISSDGYILTNNHVVAGAAEVLVRLHDRRQFVAEVIGTDQPSDMAVLKIDGEDLPVVTIGDSDALEVGEWVLAIGSPFGFDFSVTAGIVSATGRALPTENYVPFIQTDVAINPGNSGGPLFNLDGDVVGINSQIYSRTGSFNGLSFAIPIEMAMDVAQQLRETGTVRRGWLGVIINEVTMDLAKERGMRTAHGAIVANILEDSPASRSDLRPKDVITHFNGRRIERSSGLPPLVGRVPVGTDATLTVVRGGETLSVTVTIGELPGEGGIRTSSVPKAAADDNRLALTVAPVDDDTREALNVDRGGVLVTDVDPDGPAARAGIVEGDVILAIDNSTVDSADELDDVMGSIGDQGSIPVLIQRESGPEWLALKFDE